MDLHISTNRCMALCIIFIFSLLSYLFRENFVMIYFLEGIFISLGRPCCVALVFLNSVWIFFFPS